MYIDESKTYLGVVEDNIDPIRLGRCRIRVFDIYDDIPTEHIPWASPWKDVNGNQFNVPEVGKILTVVFESGNIYKPEYIYAEHFNKNLENKLKTLVDQNYTTMKALIFDHKTQIYSNDGEGLKIDYKYNNINLVEDSININLKDNTSKVNIGTPQSDQQAILGTNFLNWFDEWVDIMMGLKSGPYIDSNGAPVLPDPILVAILEKYKALKDPKFLSQHVNIVDNNYIKIQDRKNSPKLNPEAQLGDDWSSTVLENNLTRGEGVDFRPTDTLTFDTPDGDLTNPNSIEGTDSNLDGNSGSLLNGSNHPDAIRILKTMQSKKYTILSGVDQINLVGVRRQYEGNTYSNKFRDDLYAIWKDSSNKIRIRKWRISTMPGYYKALEVQTKDGIKLKSSNYKLKSGESFSGNTKGGVPIDVKLTSIMQGRGGMGILANAQYLDIYRIGEHGGEKALITKGKQRAYRDRSSGDIIKYTSTNEGFFGMHIHKGFPSGEFVNNWSEGCQILRSKSDLKELFEILEIHRTKWGNSFNYTLLLERDLDPLSIFDETQTGIPVSDTQTNTGSISNPNLEQSVIESPNKIEEDFNPEQPVTESNKEESIYTFKSYIDGSTIYIDIIYNNLKIGTKEYSSITFTIDSATEDVKFVAKNFGIFINGQGYPKATNLF
jgi:hypothetical protein